MLLFIKCTGHEKFQRRLEVHLTYQVAAIGGCGGGGVWLASNMTPLRHRDVRLLELLWADLEGLVHEGCNADTCPYLGGPCVPYLLHHMFRRAIALPLTLASTFNSSLRLTLQTSSIRFSARTATTMAREWKLKDVTSLSGLKSTITQILLRSSN